MDPNAMAGAVPAVGDGSSRSLLRWGMVVGPFYLAVGLAQALVRDGFVFAKHPLSVLANGPGGGVQTANFVLSGLMVVAAAVGMARVLGRGASGLAAFSVGCGLAILGGFFGGAMLGPAGIWGIWVAVVAEFLWLGIISARLRGEAAPV